MITMIKSVVKPEPSLQDQRAREFFQTLVDQEGFSIIPSEYADMQHISRSIDFYCYLKDKNMNRQQDADVYNLLISIQHYRNSSTMNIKFIFRRIPPVETQINMNARFIHVKTISFDMNTLLNMIVEEYNIAEKRFEESNYHTISVADDKYMITGKGANQTNE